MAEEIDPGYMGSKGACRSGEHRLAGASTTTTISILGPVVVARNGKPVALSPLHRRIVGVLAAHHPATVGWEALSQALYASNADRARRRSLHTAVWRLRGQLGDVVATSGGGYGLAVPSGAVDLDAFVRNCETARSMLLDRRFPDAARQARAALSLWRGPVMSDCTPLFALPERAARAAELRDETVEDWAEATIRDGAPSAGIADLVALTGRQPLRERAWALLVQAYTAMGQHFDAQEASAAARDGLAAIGLDPGPLLGDAIQQAAGSRMVALAVRRDPAHHAVPAWLRAAADASPFVGRSAEVGLATQALDKAEGGLPQLFVLTGEPGAGKTRLAAEVARHAESRGFRIWTGRGDRSGAVPYGSLLELVPDLLGRVSPVVAGRLAGGPVAALAADDILAFSDPLDDAHHRASLFRDIGTLFAAATGEHPGVLVFDDLQWATPATLALLGAVLRSPSGTRLCVVATYCDEEPGSGRAPEAFRELIRWPFTQLVALPGLRTEEIATHPKLPTDAAGDRRHALARRLERLSGGNPRLLTELLREPESLGSVCAGRAPLPLGLSTAVDCVLSVLNESQRSLLSGIAVISPRFEAHSVRAIAAMLAAAGEKANVDQTLEAAERAGIIQLAADDHRVYEFRHLAVALGLANEMTGMARARLRFSIADHFAAGPGGEGQDEVYLDGRPTVAASA